jgi:hypothetical protein
MRICFASSSIPIRALKESVVADQQRSPASFNHTTIAVLGSEPEKSSMQ